jgi:hypothetical protein
MATLAAVGQRRPLLLNAVIYPALILLVNLFIVAKEFKVDYSAYVESIEGTFIAIAKHVAAHPSDLLWWPLWDLGLPYQNTYIPGLHILVGVLSRLTGCPPGLSFHRVCASFFALGPVAVYFMAWGMTRLPGTSWFAALTYSLVSPTAWLIPTVRHDMGGASNLRRLQILAYYGEGPHTACLFFIPLAILLLYFALTRGRLWMNVCAGVLMAMAILMNAFAAVILGIATIALVAASPAKRIWRNTCLALAIALLAYIWITPLLPPSLAADIRRNSAQEYPFNAVSTLGLGIIVFVAVGISLVTINRVSAPFRIYLIFTLIVASIVLLGYYAGSNVVPQPHRYGVITDMGLSLCGTFLIAAVFRRLPRRIVSSAIIVIICVAAYQARHDGRFARRVIQGIDVTKTTAYHLAAWMDAHMHGERVFIGGAQSFHFNAFTDTPQFHGGHDPMQPSLLTPIGVFVIAGGMNTGTRDTEICTVWLKALGAHAFSVPGPISDSYFKTFPHPERFEARFPVLWHESDTTAYAVPTKSHSLAHVVPASALVQHFPVNGLDIDEMSRYVAAMEDPAIPEASFRWLNWHTADIEARLTPGQVISIQERYMPGWTAFVNGQDQEVEHDGLGFMFLKPACSDCRVTIRYDGGPQWRRACLASLLVTLFGIAALAKPWLGRGVSRYPKGNGS